MFGLIGWIGRFLLILFVVRAVLNLFTPRQRRPVPPPGGPRPGGPFGGRPQQTERVGGQLVRCAQCGTYVPETKAVTAGGALHFCSAACRQQYAEAHSS